MKRKRSLRRLFLGLVACLAVAVPLAVASSASAARVVYYQAFLYPTEAYPYAGGALQSGVYYNNAYYEGSGTVSVCEKATSSNGTVMSRRCGNNGAGSEGDLYFNTGCSGSFPMAMWIGNNSSYAHTIKGDFVTYC
ncbi:MAG: hypothetical protein ACTHNP_08945 [Solirubrobacterales bacterium]